MVTLQITKIIPFQHTAVMMSNLQSALRTQRHTDLDIRCGSNIFSVHKVIVCAFSRHLDSLCTDDPSLTTIRDFHKISALLSLI